MMELADRLEIYRKVLKQMDICTKGLRDCGFVEEKEQEKTEKFVLGELRRVERALGALGKPPVPQLPGRERIAGNGHGEIAEPPGGATAKAMAAKV